jgi:hypothetical protein
MSAHPLRCDVRVLAKADFFTRRMGFAFLVYFNPPLDIFFIPPSIGTWRKKKTGGRKMFQGSFTWMISASTVAYAMGVAPVVSNAMKKTGIPTLPNSPAAARNWNNARMLWNPAR